MVLSKKLNLSSSSSLKRKFNNSKISKTTTTKINFFKKNNNNNNCIYHCKQQRQFFCSNQNNFFKQNPPKFKSNGFSLNQNQIKLFSEASDKKAERLKYKEELKKRLKTTILAQDLREFAQTMGKVAHSNELIPHEKSRLFPGILNAFQLANRAYKPKFPDFFKQLPVSLVIVSQKRIFLGEQISPWRMAWHHLFPEYKDCFHEIVLTDDPIYRRLGRVMEYCIKATLRNQPERQSEIFYYYSDSLKKPQDNLIFRALEIENQYSAYVYLVDHNARIRWKNSGQPDINDIEDLDNVTNQLLTIVPERLHRPRILTPEKKEEDQKEEDFE